MVPPDILARVEQIDLFTSDRVEGNEVRSLVPIALGARPSEIRLVTVGLMHDRDNMFDMKGDMRRLVG